MKRMLVLTVLGVLTTGAVGCRSCDWLWRGSAVQREAAVPMSCCPEVCDPCMTVAPCGPVGEPMGTIPYAPGPAR
jgi:hypothetical protein